MTLLELTELASRLLVSPSPTERELLGKALARGVMDRLGEATPCGWEEPEVLEMETGNIKFEAPEQWRHALHRFMSATDADHMARLLLSAADRARKGSDA